jgi:hypothetical protein
MAATSNAQHSRGPSFLSQLLGRLPKALEESCSGGVTISAQKLGVKLGLSNPEDLDLLTSIIRSKNVPGWEIKKGAFGGIGRVGVKVQRGDKQHNRQFRVSEPMPKPEFCSAVQKILNEMIADNDFTMVLKPWEVANRLPQYNFHPGSPSEEAIKVAIKHGKISGFRTQAGLNAGIRRVRQGEDPQYLSEKNEEENGTNGHVRASTLASPYAKQFPQAEPANVVTLPPAQELRKVQTSTKANNGRSRK